jgi:PAS domain S-box-containing protein
MGKKIPPNKWEQTFDALPDLIMILDRDHRVVEANRAMAKKLGCDPKDLLGHPCYKIVHGTKAPPQWCPHTQLVSDGMVHITEATESILDGDYKITVSPLLDDMGTPWGCVHIARDITDLKSSQKEIKKAYDELDQRVRERTASLEVKKRQLERSRAELSERIRFEEFLSNLSTRFAALPAERVGEEVTQGLKLLVEYLNIDRSTFSAFSDEPPQLKILYSYARKGFESVPSIDLNELFPWSISKLQRKDVVVFNSLDELPAKATTDRRSFEKLGLKSHLTIPIFLGESLDCLISFGSIEKERIWPLELIPRLKLFGELLANAVSRKKAVERQRKDEEKLRRAFEEVSALKKHLEAESAYLQHEIKLDHNFENIIGQSKALKYVLFRIEQVAKTDAPVLLMGETGTGKELATRAIHSLGKRCNRPLIKINCAALPAGLIESELFGHEKGAFTGALSTQVGRFELAKGSTLFLDEIGEFPLELQAKLLRVLEGGEFERLGSPKTLKTDARIIASTNRDLEKEAEKGRFRKDLWYRLRVFPISMPPLREREDDIILLVQHFLEKYTRQMGKPSLKIRQKTLNRLMEHSWPGNIRELMHTIESAIISSRGSYLQVDLPETSTGQQMAPETLRELEHDHILKVLEMTRWKINGPGGAAAILDIHPNTLRSRMKMLGIRKESFLLAVTNPADHKQTV